MVSKTKKMNRNMCLVAIVVGIYSSVIVSSCFSGFQLNLVEEIKGQFSENAGQPHPVFLVYNVYILVFQFLLHYKFLTFFFIKLVLVITEICVI